MTAEPDGRTVEQPGAGHVAVVDNPAASRFEVHVDGELAGFAEYHDGRAGRAFTHTEVAAEYEGMGLASQLIRYALDDARTAGRMVLPFCPFVRSFIERHPDYLDLVESPQRFGLNRQMHIGGLPEGTNLRKRPGGGRVGL